MLYELLYATFYLGALIVSATWVADMVIGWVFDLFE